MTDNVMKLLEQLVREKKVLQVKEQRHAQRERQVIESLRELLPRMGYRIVPASGAVARLSGILPVMHKPKRLRCPKCERRFAHPLPMARHLKATHGVTVGSQAGKKAGRGKAKLRKSA